MPSAEAVRKAVAQLQAELTANAEGIGRVLSEPIPDTGRLDELTEVLGRYDAEVAKWSELCVEYAAHNQPVPPKDAERYSEALESLAHEFATAARKVLDAA